MLPTILPWMAAHWGAAVVNSLVPGVLLAVAGWCALKAWPRMNATTRFVLGLSLLGLLAAAPGLLLLPVGRSAAGGAVSGGSVGAAGSALPGWVEMAAALLWLGGVELLGGRLLLAGVELRRLRRSCREVDGGLLAELQVHPEGRARRARVCISPEVSSPLAMGLWRPLVVLPEGMLESCGAEDLRRLLLHELEHIRRYDDWTCLLQQVAMAGTFYQPAAWWLNRLLMEERETACDDAVLAATGEAKGYAVCLARLAEDGQRRRVPVGATAAVGRPSLLRRRVVRILENGRDVSGRLSRPVLGLVAVAAVVVLGVAARMPRLVAPETVHWEAASLGAPAVWQARQSAAATAVARQRIDRATAEELQAGARARQAAERKAREMASLRRPRLPVKQEMAAMPGAASWSVVEMQTVRWQGRERIETTRLVFVVTGPEAVRLLQTPPPVQF